MPGIFFQIYIQVVFAVKGRENLITDNWEIDLHKYISGIWFTLLSPPSGLRLLIAIFL